MSLCDDTCRPCIYSGVLTEGVCCNYILITGNRRGCPAGKGCERRVVGDRRMTIDAAILNPAKATAPKKAPPSRHAQEHKRSVRRVRDELNGRQHAAIEAYRAAHGTSFRKMALALGLNYKTLDSWVQERCRADWHRLAALGIQKPEGLPDKQKNRRTE